VRRYNAAIEAFRITKTEINHIMATPFSMLNRREVMVRKLLMKYHDDPDIIKRTFAAAAYGFDEHLAERTRMKNQRAYTREEREWMSIDKILHPEVWAYYVNHDHSTGMSEDDRKATVGGAKALQGPKKKIADVTEQRLDEGQQKVVGTLGKLLGTDCARYCRHCGRSYLYVLGLSP
jgi:hypothetical protein